MKKLLITFFSTLSLLLSGYIGTSMSFTEIADHSNQGIMIQREGDNLVSEWIANYDRSRREKLVLEEQQRATEQRGLEFLVNMLTEDKRSEEATKLQREKMAQDKVRLDIEQQKLDIEQQKLNMRVDTLSQSQRIEQVRSQAQARRNLTEKIIDKESAKSVIRDGENIYMELEFGTVIIELYPQYAPNHVQRIEELTNEGFYDGLAFHRVIDNFMAQTGDPLGTGSGKSSKPNLKAEFNELKHERGIVSMARSSDLDSANSQFFIMLGNAPHLDHQYTAFGKVISGMEYIDKIKKGDPSNNGVVIDPTRIIRMVIEKKASSSKQ